MCTTNFFALSRSSCRLHKDRLSLVCLAFRMVTQWPLAIVISIQVVALATATLPHRVIPHLHLINLHCYRYAKWWAQRLRTMAAIHAQNKWNVFSSSDRFSKSSIFSCAGRCLREAFRRQLAAWSTTGPCFRLVITSARKMWVTLGWNLRVTAILLANSTCVF